MPKKSHENGKAEPVNPAQLLAVTVSAVSLLTEQKIPSHGVHVIAVH